MTKRSVPEFIMTTPPTSVALVQDLLTGRVRVNLKAKAEEM